MKAIRCRLVLHGSFMQHDCGVFDSISKAKKYVQDIDWIARYTIIRLGPKK